MNKSFLFPVLHLTGKKWQPFGESRYWLPFVLLVVLLLYLPALFSGFFTDDNWHRLEFSRAAARKLHREHKILAKGGENLYAMSGMIKVK